MAGRAVYWVARDLSQFVVAIRHHPFDLGITPFDLHATHNRYTCKDGSHKMEPEEKAQDRRDKITRLEERFDTGDEHAGFELIQYILTDWSSTDRILAVSILRRLQADHRQRWLPWATISAALLIAGALFVKEPIPKPLWAATCSSALTLFIISLPKRRRLDLAFQRSSRQHRDAQATAMKELLATLGASLKDSSTKTAKAIGKAFADAGESDAGESIRPLTSHCWRLLNYRVVAAALAAGLACIAASRFSYSSDILLATIPPVLALGWKLEVRQ